MKRKFKILNHQIEQLKEEIGEKDLALVKEHSDFVKVEKEKESLRLDLNKARQQIMEAEGTIASQKAETVKLNHIINEADAERLRQKKEYDMVINERDILGTQLIRRNDELALLYEKIKIQQSTLAKGQTQYRDRMKEARLVKIKLNDLKRELHILKNSVANIDVLKREGTLYRIANILNSHSCSQQCKRRTGIPSPPPPPPRGGGRPPTRVGPSRAGTGRLSDQPEGGGLVIAVEHADGPAGAVEAAASRRGPAQLQLEARERAPTGLEPVGHLVALL